MTSATVMKSVVSKQVLGSDQNPGYVLILLRIRDSTTQLFTHYTQNPEILVIC